MDTGRQKRSFPGFTLSELKKILERTNLDAVLRAKIEAEVISREAEYL